MSINTVPLKNNYNQLLGSSEVCPFTLLPGEKVRYNTQSGRQSLDIIDGEHRPLTNIPTIHITARDGYLYLTTKRLIYITLSQGDVNTFTIDLSYADKLRLSHSLKSPWFGPNYWEFIFFSSESSSDGFPNNKYFKGQIKFSDGGLFNFVQAFNIVLNDVINNSHIDDELPGYSEV
ncbi:uncharacterized protein RJT21DRAFT_6225 [Scheffersomyces amazonensis]|uniref:uncharacterized protein n=1 Tax=Scheffersomyces amazonensis TaxID=1078765 RepID=UPI00315DC905